MPKIPTIREILYPEPEARFFDSEEPLDAETAKQLLGWRETSKGEKHHIKDSFKRSVICDHTTRFQRFWYPKVIEDLKWKILGGQWEFNFETIIVGKTGWILDGKHRLAALVMAQQEWEKDPDQYPYWEDEPFIQTLVGLGAEERDRVVNTISTGKMRTVSESLFSSGMVDGYELKEAKKACRVLEFAVRVLWQRTGAKEDAFNPKINHSEAFGFLDNHPGLMSTVKVVMEENGGAERRIIQLLPGGHAAALLYLMSVSKSNPVSYGKRRHEDQLDFSLQERAEEYWVKLSTRDSSVAPIISAIAKLADAGNTSVHERVGIIIKGWSLFASKKKITSDLIRLKVTKNKDGMRTLAEDPTVAGIDVGWQLEG